MTPDQLAAAIQDALGAVLGERRGEAAVPQVRLERPRDPRQGQWASPVALQVARALGTLPRPLAQDIVELLVTMPGIAAAEVAGPGFINVVLAADAAGEIARRIVEAGADYGRAPRSGEQVTVVSIVSGPAGSWHLGHVRAAVAGDAMARVIEAGGAQVRREQSAACPGGQAGDQGWRELIGVRPPAGQRLSPGAGAGRSIVLLAGEGRPDIPCPRADGATAGNPVEVIAGQAVRLRNAGHLPGRTDPMALLRGLVEAAGADALRYAMTRSPAGSVLELDVGVLASARPGNPAYDVRYAYARAATTARRAAEDGVHREDGFSPELLVAPAETELLAVLGDYPRVVAQAARRREPHRVARYLEELAAVCHRWQDTCPVRPVSAAEPVTELHRTRRWVNDAAAQVLGNGLGLLGVDAPPRL